MVFAVVHPREGLPVIVFVDFEYHMPKTCPLPRADRYWQCETVMLGLSTGSEGHAQTTHHPGMNQCSIGGFESEIDHIFIRHEQCGAIDVRLVDVEGNPNSRAGGDKPGRINDYIVIGHTGKNLKKVLAQA